MPWSGLAREASPWRCWRRVGRLPRRLGMRYPAAKPTGDSDARFRRRLRPPRHRRGCRRGAARRRHRGRRRPRGRAGLHGGRAGAGGVSRRRLPDGARAGRAGPRTRFLRRDAETLPPGGRARLSRHRGAVRHGDAGIPHRCRLDCRARRRRRPCRGARPLWPPADDRACRAGHRRRARGRARDRLPVLRLQHHQADPRGDPGRPRAVLPRRHADARGFCLPEPRFRRCAGGLRARRPALRHRGRGGTGAAGGLRRGRAPDARRSLRLSPGLARAADRRARGRANCRQPAALAWRRAGAVLPGTARARSRPRGAGACLRGDVAGAGRGGPRGPGRGRRPAALARLRRALPR